MKHTLIERKIYEMLTENTGIHFLDSGGSNGRAWQRNQNIPIEAFKILPDQLVDFEVYRNELEISFIKPLFPFLSEQLEYLPNWQSKFTRFANKYPNDSWYELVDRFAEKHHDAEWSDRFRKPTSSYTYNYECALSQDIMFTEFENYEGTFVILQIHNGADARGGFTNPKIFKIKDWEEFYCNHHGSIYCDNLDCDTYWNTYDAGYSWESDYVEQLKEFQIKEVDSINLDGTQAGIIQVHDKRASCPKCSKGLIGG